MRGSAIIEVTCDECGYSEPVELCPLATSGVWDERYVNKHLDRNGWTWTKEKDLCVSCSESMDELDSDPEE